MELFKLELSARHSDTLYRKQNRGSHNWLSGFINFEFPAKKYTLIFEYLKIDVVIKIMYFVNAFTNFSTTKCAFVLNASSKKNSLSRLLSNFSYWSRGVVLWWFCMGVSLHAVLEMVSLKLLDACNFFCMFFNLSLRTEYDLVST